MKAQPPPQPHAKLPQAGQSLQVQVVAGFTLSRTQPQEGQEALENRQEVSQRLY